MPSMTPLKKLRLKNKLKVEDVRKCLHIHRISYWRIENGRVSPGYPLALKLVEFWRLRGCQISTEEIILPDKRKAKAARKLAA